jgi:hypothetical protein
MTSRMLLTSRVMILCQYFVQTISLPVGSSLTILFTCPADTCRLISFYALAIC